MRNVIRLSAAVLLLASAGVASAQTTVNFGYRGNSVTGDEARWERYRDLRAGPLFGLNYNAEDKNSVLTFDAFNVGYHDQAYGLKYNNFGKLKFSGLWNSIPLNYAYNTLTPYTTTGGNVWQLDPATRLAVQNKTAFGIGTTAADFTKASVYRGLATPFSLQSRRDIIDLGLKYQLSKVLGLDLGFNSAKRGGTLPFGAAFAFNDAQELPLTLDDRTNDINAGLEFAKNNSMLRLEWLNSHYKNQFTSLTWDNPIRATDFSNGKAPPAGPYDGSGYSNGNGPAFGRLALSPSNSMNSFSLVGLHKLPGRTTLNGQFSFATMKQNADLLPWTTNASIANSAVYAVFPGLASLPRSSAQAEVRSINAMFNFNTRPTRDLAFNVRYRYNDHDNRTPTFDYSYNVRFDAVPEATPGETTVNYNIKRNTLDAGASLNLPHNSSLGVNYIFDDVKRTHRSFGNMTDYTVRISLDTWGNQYLSLRGVFENTRRRGSGFSELAIEESASQPAFRFYDEADYNRNKGMLNLQITPSDKLDLGLSVSSGKDKYNGADHEFGLLDNSNTGYDANLNLYLTKQLTVAGNYGYEKFSALQASRNASPTTGLPGYDSWFDANRNWELNNDETVKTYGASVDLTKAIAKTDIRLSYDRSNSDNAFVFSGPRIQEFMTNQALTAGDGTPCSGGVTSCFSQFAPVTNNWQEFRVSLSHDLGTRLGLGLGYQYSKLEVVDFATTNLADGTPRIDPLGAITTGYGNRPYKANLFTAQFTYKFQAAPFLF